MTSWSWEFVHKWSFKTIWPNPNGFKLKKQINETVILNFEFENKYMHTALVYPKMHFRGRQQVYIISIINQSPVKCVKAMIHYEICSDSNH